MLNLEKFPYDINHYEYYFKDCSQKKEALIVTFSPGAGFAYYKKDFKHDTLYIRSKGDSYYTMQAGRLADNIKAFFVSGGYEKILFIGSSKGGFASLLYGALLARRVPNAKVVSVAFSPQTRIFPYNEKLTFPSYQRLYKSVNSGALSNMALSCLKKYGDVTSMLKQKNLFCDVYYPEFLERDVREACRLVGYNIRKNPIPIKIHSVGLLCSLDNKNRSSVEKLCERLYSKRKTELDLMHTLPEVKQKLIDAIMSIKFVRPIDVIIEEDLNF